MNNSGRFLFGCHCFHSRASRTPRSLSEAAVDTGSPLNDEDLMPKSETLRLKHGSASKSLPNRRK